MVKREVFDSTYQLLLVRTLQSFAKVWYAPVAVLWWGGERRAGRDRGEGGVIVSTTGTLTIHLRVSVRAFRV